MTPTELGYRKIKKGTDTVRNFYAWYDETKWTQISEQEYDSFLSGGCKSSEIMLRDVVQGLKKGERAPEGQSPKGDSTVQAIGRKGNECGVDDYFKFVNGDWHQISQAVFNEYELMGIKQVELNYEADQKQEGKTAWQDIPGLGEGKMEMREIPGVPGKPEPKPKPQNPGKAKVEFNMSESVEDIFRSTMEKAVEEFVDCNQDEFGNKVEEVVKRELQKIQPTHVHINNVEVGKIDDENVHKSFEQAIFFAVQERQLFIAGPAGSGKTTLASQISKALNLPFGHISCSSGTSEAHLLGRMLFNGDYVASDLVELYEGGGVFLFDEIDAADANTMLVVNSALANGKLSVPNRKGNTTAYRHKDFICVCAGNTWGAGSLEYHGRNYLDAAFLDRFVLSKMIVDYDVDLERRILSNDADLSERIWEIRKQVTDQKLRKVISTRIFASAARYVSAGKKHKEILDILTVDWSVEEKKKVAALTTWVPKKKEFAKGGIVHEAKIPMDAFEKDLAVYNDQPF